MLYFMLLLELDNLPSFIRIVALLITWDNVSALILSLWFVLPEPEHKIHLTYQHEYELNIMHLYIMRRASVCHSVRADISSYVASSCDQLRPMWPAVAR